MNVFQKIAKKLGFGKSKSKTKVNDPLAFGGGSLQESLNDPLREPLQEPLESKQDTTTSDTTSTELGVSTVEGESTIQQGEGGETIKLEPKGEKTDLTVEIGGSSDGEGITEGVKGVTEGKKVEEPKEPKYKTMRVLMYTPYTSNGSVLDPQSGGTGVESRLKLLDEQLEAAMEYAKEDGPDTLRIFMAPEWFFAGSDGSPYSGSEIGQAIKGLEKISAKYPDLLLVPGSIKWSPGKGEFAKPETEGKKGKKKGKPETVQRDLIHNTQPVFKDGKLVHAYHKQHNGGDAPVKEAMPLDVESQQPLKDYRQDQSVQPQRHTGATTGRFDVDGIQFGLDVCADFSQGTLARELMQEDPEHGGVDVHMVTSAGIMGANNDLTAAKDGGYTLISDGSRQWERSAESQDIAWKVQRDGPLSKGLLQGGKGVTTESIDHERRSVGTHQYNDHYGNKRNYSNHLRWTDKLQLPGR